MDETKVVDAAPTADVEAPTESVGVEVPSKFKKLVEEIETMTVLELSELVKVLEKKFGVSAAAVAVVGPAAGAAPEEEGKSTADVELTEVGASKIAVIKAVKEALALGLKEAKDLVDGAPSMLKTGMKKEDAAELAKKLTDAGAKVTLK
ncbi:MAG: 50S ribosomal protein L7/L12 [Candidatus Paceibacterota bacterium]|jgi:large subunit ribosomal protein L7/L12